MSTLAQILHDLGHEVTGYDDAKDYKFTQAGLDQRKIKIYYDHEHEISKDTIVTYSVAFKETHPEMKRVKELGLTIKPYAEIMGEVIKEFKTIGVSGTHGKTSTSSMIRHILENTIGCNYFIGAGDGMAKKENEYYVVESDEFNRHFLYYEPKYSIITNIECEHMEIYKDIDDIRNTFEKFANQTSDLVIANGDNEEVRKINYNTKVLFYGFQQNNDIIIKNCKLNEENSEYDLWIDGKEYAHVEIPLFGKHMIANSAAAIAMCNHIGIKKEEILKYMKTFKNAKRRFETTKIEDTIIIDDYAHHPTEIKATLEGARQRYPKRKIVVVFRPNTYSRTKDFTKEFIDALKIADKLYMTEIQANREKQEDYPGVSSHMIMDHIENAENIEEETISKLKKEKGNVVLFMGCADNSHLIEGFKEEIK